MNCIFWLLIRKGLLILGVCGIVVAAMQTIGVLSEVGWKDRKQVVAYCFPLEVLYDEPV